MAYKKKKWSHGKVKRKVYPQHKGWVYVLSNPAYDNPIKVKVGYTDRPVERRIEELEWARRQRF